MAAREKVILGLLVILVLAELPFFFLYLIFEGWCQFVNREQDEWIELPFLKGRP